jgi:hypothetical protein
MLKASGGLDQGVCASVTTQNVARRPVADDLSTILDSPEICDLIDRLQATRWTGRPGYPMRTMVGIALAKAMYSLPTWTRTVALVREHAALAAVIAPHGALPSIDACYRFTRKLREHKPLLDTCIASVVRALKRRDPTLGWDVAIDASDMPAYANGQRFVSKGGRERSDHEFSDPDASWGHRSAVSTRKGGGFYGYRFTSRCAQRRICRSRGVWRPPGSTKRCPSARCSTSWRHSGSTPRQPHSTRATTTPGSMRTVH